MTATVSGPEAPTAPGPERTKARRSGGGLGRYILVRATTDTRGHGTHTWAKFWRQELIDLLARTE